MFFYQDFVELIFLYYLLFLTIIFFCLLLLIDNFEFFISNNKNIYYTSKITLLDFFAITSFKYY